MTDCPCRLLDLDPDRWTWTPAGSALERALVAIGEADNCSAVMHAAPYGPDVAYVYVLVRDDRIIYVGRTIDLHNRLSQHRSSSGRQRAKVFDAVAFVHSSAAGARRIESLLVAELQPPENAATTKKKGGAK